jgi:hypothetical protein
MGWSLDARVLVKLGRLEQAGPGDALLVEGDGPVGGGAHFRPVASEHSAGCACCAPRSPAALALNALFQARAKGEGPFFRRVVAVTQTEAGRTAVWAAVSSDPLTAGRFRLAD